MGIIGAILLSGVLLWVLSWVFMALGYFAVKYGLGAMLKMERGESCSIGLCFGLLLTLLVFGSVSIFF